MSEEKLYRFIYRGPADLWAPHPDGPFVAIGEEVELTAYQERIGVTYGHILEYIEEDDAGDDGDDGEAADESANVVMLDVQEPIEPEEILTTDYPKELFTGDHENDDEPAEGKSSKK